MKAIKVQHVRISKSEADVTIKFQATARKVVCTTPWRSLPPITVVPRKGKFEASISTKSKYFVVVDGVIAKTPAKAFAKAVRAFWA